MWLVNNNMLSGRIYDLKEKSIKIENRQKDGEEDLEQEALDQLNDEMHMSINLKNSTSGHMGKKKYMEKYFQSEITGLIN